MGGCNRQVEDAGTGFKKEAWCELAIGDDWIVHFGVGTAESERQERCVGEWGFDELGKRSRWVAISVGTGVRRGFLRRDEG